MEWPQSTIGRVTFIVHVIVAILVGLPLLVVPVAYGALFGYPAPPPDLVPILRSFGAMLLAFGGLTSFLCIRAPSWNHVLYILRGEVAYTAIQTLVFVLSAAAGVGPAFGNWLFAAITAVLLVGFALTLAAYPRPAEVSSAPAGSPKPA